MRSEPPTNLHPQEDNPINAETVAPFGSPCLPLQRFSFEAPRLGWGFCMHGWTNCYLILWDGAVHDGDWFEQNRGKIVGRYDDWEGPHYGDAVVLHMVHLNPGVPHRDLDGFEAEAIRKALQHLINPIPAHAPVTAWQSVQYYEYVDESVCEIYQALFLEPEGERDLLRLAYALRSLEERYDPPELLRLDQLELKGYQDCCVEVSVPRDKFRKVYREAVFVH